MNWTGPIVGTMRVGWAVCRWGLMVALAFGVLSMHHIPAHADHGATKAPYAAGGAHGLDAVSAGHEAAPCDCDSSTRTPREGTVPAPGSPLLHLCLAIALTAMATIAVLAMRRGIPCPVIQGFGRSVARIGARHLRPPIPVPRRLAVLCVLRL